MHLVRRVTLFILLVSAASGALREAAAETCGDADGNGAVTVTDGVQALRNAAALGSVCSGRVCDADGQGQVTVSDGVVILRAAAALPAKLTCGTEISGIFGGIRKVIGAQTPRLELGAPPPPGSEPTVGTPVGTDQVRTGRSVAYSVPYQLDEPGDLIVAARGDDGARIEGFYSLALPAGTGTVEIQLPTERNTDPSAEGLVDVEFFTRSQTAVSTVSSTELHAHQVRLRDPPDLSGRHERRRRLWGRRELPGGRVRDARVPGRTERRRTLPRRRRLSRRRAARTASGAGTARTWSDPAPSTRSARARSAGRISPFRPRALCGASRRKCSDGPRRPK